MRSTLAMFLFCLLLTGCATQEEVEMNQNTQTPAALNFTVNTISGESVELSKYKGSVVLIVNVASRCGHTPQYAGLQALYETHKDRGLAILGFPCNQFGAQEPASNEDIQTFCSTNYNVTFDMFAKVDVNGDSATPIYQYLTADDAPIEDTGDVKWNFEKFLIDREGNLIARFRSGVQPNDDALLNAIEAAL